MQYYNNNTTSHERIMFLLTTKLKFYSTPSVLPGYYRIRWWKQSVDTLYSTCKQRPYLIYKLTNNNKYYISCIFSSNYRQLEYKCVTWSIWHDSHDFTMYHNKIYFCPVVTNFCLTASGVYPYNMRFFANGDNPDTKLEKKYAPALDNYGQSCFVRSDFFKMKCVCKTQNL